MVPRMRDVRRQATVRARDCGWGTALVTAGSPEVLRSINRTRGKISLGAPTLLNQEQRWIFEEVAELFEVLGAEGAIDDAVIAAHGDRHTVADDDLVTIVNYRNFVYLPYCKNESLRWIDYGRKAIDAHAAEI